MIQNISAITSLLACMAISSPSFAKDPSRRPFEPSEARTTSVELDRYHEAQVIKRNRSANRSHAVFSATSQAVNENAAYLFVARSLSASGSVVRWRCLAKENVSECFAKPVRIRYLPTDTAIELVISAMPKATTEKPNLLASSR